MWFRNKWATASGTIHACESVHVGARTDCDWRADSSTWVTESSWDFWRSGRSDVGSRDHIQINGVPVRIHGHFEREVTDVSGARVAELEVVVMIRGRIPNKQFIQLISQDHVRLDVDDVGTTVTWFTRIGNHTAVGSGSGEGTVYRHDILFRETPESYKRRADERAAAQAAMPAPEPVRRPAVPEPEAPGEISDVLANADPSGWGEAIRQLKTGGQPRPSVWEEPMTVTELTAIESVLTNLRIDALIDQLEAAGVLRRGSVDERFRILVEQRFVSEAIPLVGEKIARRAANEF